MQGTVEHATCPMIEVASDGRVRWMNRLAEERMRNHPGLLVAAGRLRARRQDRDAALREALRWAFAELETHVPPRLAAQQARAVPLGEDDAAVPLYCWVVLEDGKARCLSTTWLWPDDGSSLPGRSTAFRRLRFGWQG